jgi:hypothetical protein
MALGSSVLGLPGPTVSIPLLTHRDAWRAKKVVSGPKRFQPGRRTRTGALVPVATRRPHGRRHQTQASPGKRHGAPRIRVQRETGGRLAGRRIRGPRMNVPTPRLDRSGVARRCLEGGAVAAARAGQARSYCSLRACGSRAEASNVESRRRSASVRGGCAVAARTICLCIRAVIQVRDCDRVRLQGDAVPPDRRGTIDHANRTTVRPPV